MRKKKKLPYSKPRFSRKKQVVLLRRMFDYSFPELLASESAP